MYMSNFQISSAVVILIAALMSLYFGKVELKFGSPLMLLKKGELSLTPIIVCLSFIIFAYLSDDKYIVREKLYFSLGVILIFQQVSKRYINE